MTGPAELRCPQPVYEGGPGKLLGKTLPGGLVEVSCPVCLKARRQAGEPVTRVLHRFSPLGQLVETEAVVSGSNHSHSRIEVREAPRTR